MARKSAHRAAPPAPPAPAGDTFDPSVFTVIRAEDLEAIDRIKAGLIAHYQPANSEELFAIERIALARHSLLRVYRMESGLVMFGIQKAIQMAGTPRILEDPEEPGRPPVTSGQKASFWMSAGFCEANRMSHWQFFLRYQAQTERFYRHAIEDFERLRRHRGRTPQQPVTDPAPEPAAKGPARAASGVSAPAQPGAFPAHPPRRVSHRRRSLRAVHVAPRGQARPPTWNTVEARFPNAP